MGETFEHAQGKGSSTFGNCLNNAEPLVKARSNSGAPHALYKIDEQLRPSYSQMYCSFYSRFLAYNQSHLAVNVRRKMPNWISLVRTYY